EDEVTGNKADGYLRRAPGTAGMKDGVRYNIYESKDGHVLFMASEREFWKNFCDAIGRPELFERHPGAKYADHAVGNVELRRELPVPSRAPTVGEHTQAVLRGLLGYDEARMAALTESGALGPEPG